VFRDTASLADVVPDGRRIRILTRLADPALGTTEPTRLCEVCAAVTVMSGAGIMLMSGDASQGSVCTTNDVSALIEDLQYTLGEGPCVDAYHQQQPVLEPDLAGPHPSRWLAFTPPAVQAGVRAVFGFPLQVGSARVGALNLYRDQPGPLTPDQHADALVMADVAARAILALQADAPIGELAAELRTAGELRLVVHQATGMVSAQLEVTVAEALVRLRAYAFAHDRGLTDVARDVVTRRLRFGPPDS
jgi:GAF domain-containing protein